VNYLIRFPPENRERWTCSHSWRFCENESKRFVDVASLPPDYEIAPEWEYVSCIDHAASRANEDQDADGAGFHQPDDVENRLGYHVGQLGTESPKK
jgi:hypothetical protein